MVLCKYVFWDTQQLQVHTPHITQIVCFLDMCDNVYMYSLTQLEFNINI